MVSCFADDAQAIDLYEVCLSAQQQGTQFPVLVRFPEIIRGRLHEIQVEVILTHAQQLLRSFVPGQLPDMVAQCTQRSACMSLVALQLYQSRSHAGVF